MKGGNARGSRARHRARRGRGRKARRVRQGEAARQMQIETEGCRERDRESETELEEGMTAGGYQKERHSGHLPDAHHFAILLSKAINNAEILQMLFFYLSSEI